jgi:hypothetical protein
MRLQKYTCNEIIGDEMNAMKYICDEIYAMK